MATKEVWRGGYVHRDSKGRPTYVIRKRIGGTRFEVSTRCQTERAAFRELERFEADPRGYQAGGAPGPEPVFMTAELVGEFSTFSEEKGNTAKWVTAQLAILGWWADELAGVDLRRAPLEKIEEPLKGVGGRAKRIATIKAFYAWLVEGKRLLSPAEDPTFRKLKVPQSKPEQQRRVKAIPKGDYADARRRLKGVIGDRWIDALDVLAGTGWHVTECQRFAAGGEILSYVGKGAAGVLVCPMTKGGEPLRTAVSAPVLAAAKRLREAGGFSPEALRRAITRARKDDETIPDLRPGSFRHSVATHAIDAGADAKAASDFLGHKSTRTTRKFYATHATPKKIPTLL